MCKDSESYKNENWFTNNGASAISVRGVFNKKYRKGIRSKKHYFSDANYSIKHNNKVLLYGILEIDVFLIENWFTNKGARAISIRGVFNKNLVNFS